MSARLVDRYLAEYFAFYPTRATQAGNAAHDAELERFSEPRIAGWIRFNHVMRDSGVALLARLPDRDDRVDLGIMVRQADRELFEYEHRRRQDRDPNFWVGPVSEATVFLLLRTERPLALRYALARSRVRLIPTYLAQAAPAIRALRPHLVAPEVVAGAAEQLRAAAGFYRAGFVTAGAGLERPVLDSAAAEGQTAAAALDGMVGELEALAVRATGSPRLGTDYGAVFRLETGIEEPTDTVLARGERELVEVRVEAAAYGRSVWGDLMPGQASPADDRDVLRALFARLAAARDVEVGPYLAYWRGLVPRLEAFVREHRIATLPEPLTLEVTTAPGFMAGQSVGGVFAAGPYAADATTFLFVPVPSPGADSAGRARFFRDFNRPFTAMIAAHELMPGHYLQGKTAARGGHPIRAIFADGVYVEGWGTFSERVMLEAGWGGPLEWLAHYKKQLENAARLVVDIRVHTRAMTREDMVRFVRDEALQGEQLAGNMWIRTLTTAPQITSYHLGDRQLKALLAAVRAKEGTSFAIGRFMDRMMSLGSAPIPVYRALLLDQ